MQTTSTSYCVFKYNGHTTAIQVTVSTSQERKGFVLRSTLEEHFGTTFPPASATFSSDGNSLCYESDQNLQVLLPHRLACFPGQMIEITEKESDILSKEIPNSYAYQVMGEVQALQISEVMTGVRAGSGPEASSLTFHESSTAKYCLSPPHSKIQPSAPQLHLPAYHEEKLAMESFRQHPLEFSKRALIYTKAEEILTKRYTAYESNAPRLFVILPVEGEEAGVVSEPQFRIHFLCESGQDNRTFFSHLQSEGGHSGYPIRRREDFFTLFAPYLTVMLETLRLGMSVGGHRFNTIELEDQGHLHRRVVEALQYLEKLRSSDSSPNDMLDEHLQYIVLKQYLSETEKVDLTKVANYIQANVGDNLGGLFRSLESTSMAKWICHEHHQMISGSSKDARAQLSRLSTSNSGVFDEQRGLVRAVLTSSLAAKNLYLAIGGVPDVQELDLTLDWNTSYRDLGKLQDMIEDTIVSTITLNLNNHAGPEIELGFQGRYSPIFSIMRHSTVRSVTLLGIDVGLWDRAVIPPGDAVFRHLKRIRIP